MTRGRGETARRGLEVRSQTTEDSRQMAADSPATSSGQAGSPKFRNPRSAIYNLPYAPCSLSYTFLNPQSEIPNPKLQKCLVPLPSGDFRDLHRLWK